MVTERRGVEHEAPPEPTPLELREAVAARDELLAVIGHELRNSMSPLVLLVQLFEAMPAADDFMKAKIAMLSRNLKAFRSTLDRVSEVTQLRDGKLVLQPEPCELGQLVREVCADKPAEVEISGAVMSGVWDRTRVKQIVDHLVSNAIQYGAGPIRITLAEHGRDAEIVVEDRGAGIPPELRDRLFDRFDRKGPRRHGSGLGVGLWVVKQLCRAMGGNVRLVDSDCGARFSVTLPRA